MSQTRGSPSHGSLTELEWDCMVRYVDVVADRLKTLLVEVWLFGSAARGEMWSVQLPMRSDIDLLFLTNEPLSTALTEELINATYPLFLECGRHISPQFWTLGRFTSPDEGAQAFVSRVRTEGRMLLRSPGQPQSLWPMDTPSGL